MQGNLLSEVAAFQTTTDAALIYLAENSKEVIKADIDRSKPSEFLIKLLAHIVLPTINQLNREYANPIKNLLFARISKSYRESTFTSRQTKSLPIALRLIT